MRWLCTVTTMLIPWGEVGAMSRALLSSKAGVSWPTRASMLPTAHPQSWECVALILASAPEHKKDRGRVILLAHLNSAPSGRGGASRAASSNPTMTWGHSFSLLWTRDTLPLKSPPYSDLWTCLWHFLSQRGISASANPSSTAPQVQSRASRRQSQILRW